MLLLVTLELLWQQIFNLLYLFIFKYVFISLFQILVVACRIFSCGMWDLVPWPGIEHRPPVLGMCSFNHWTTREVPFTFWCQQGGNMYTLMPTCSQTITEKHGDITYWKVLVYMDSEPVILCWGPINVGR